MSAKDGTCAHGVRLSRDCADCQRTMATTTDEWFARQLKRAHPESAADIDAAVAKTHASDEPRAHAKTCRFWRLSACDCGATAFNETMYAASDEQPERATPSGLLADSEDDVRAFNRLCEYLTNANIPIVTAVLAEVARLDAENADDTFLVPLPAAIHIQSAARAIRVARRLAAGGV